MIFTLFRWFPLFGWKVIPSIFHVETDFYLQRKLLYRWRKPKKKINKYKNTLLASRAIQALVGLLPINFRILYCETFISGSQWQTVSVDIKILSQGLFVPTPELRPSVRCLHSSNISSEAIGPIETKLCMEPQLSEERKFVRVSGSPDQDGPHAYIWKKPLIFFSGTNEAVAIGLDMQRLGHGPIVNWSNDDTGLTVTFFMARLNLVPYAFYGVFRNCHRLC